MFGLDTLIVWRVWEAVPYERRAAEDSRPYPVPGTFVGLVEADVLIGPRACPYASVTTT